MTSHVNLSGTKRPIAPKAKRTKRSRFQQSTVDAGITPIAVDIGKEASCSIEAGAIVACMPFDDKGQPAYFKIVGQVASTEQDPSITSQSLQTYNAFPVVCEIYNTLSGSKKKSSSCVVVFELDATTPGTSTTAQIMSSENIITSIPPTKLQTWQAGGTFDSPPVGGITQRRAEYDAKVSELQKRH